ncbi:NAD-dependent protein deacylase [Colletotrichum tanaceti]|uniref:NAD-dependent protein deacylase n=1 Tax=Colletotrichum tanaceti TaxID=1306861 RepID=A0A4U6XFN9_9PEZI|nr:NAD-dependent protein deacylase [Colletotrichum tanaceti]
MSQQVSNGRTIEQRACSGPSGGRRLPRHPQIAQTYHRGYRSRPLGAFSGLAVFRGTGELWRNQDVTQIASPAGFRHEPSLSWQFHSHRRQDALRATPNPAHRALGRAGPPRAWR